MKKASVGYNRLVKIALVAVVLAVAVFVNLLAIEAVGKFSLKVDLTDNKLYELSSLTSEVGKNVSDTVVITVFGAEADFPVMIREILARYAQLSSKIVVEYKDPYENPVLVDSFRQKGYSIAENDILINGKSKIRQLKISDLYLFNASKTEITALRAEQALTSALIYANTDGHSKVEFTDGHGERPSGGLITIFQENNFEFKRVVLSVMEIADVTDMVVIAAPERDFQEDEIVKLEKYLDRGGRLLVFVEPALGSLVNFEKFLKKWGIELGRAVVFEEKAYLSNNPLNIVPMYAPHPINAFFGDKRFFLVSPATRSLKKSAWNEYELEVLPVLTSSPASYGKTGKDFVSTSRAEDDVAGPFMLALSSVRKVVAAGEELESRVLILGSKSFYGDDLLGRSSYANRDFLVQAINWLGQKDSSISIPAKNIRPDPLNVLPETIWIIGIVFIAVVPLVILLIGIVVCLRRKRL